MWNKPFPKRVKFQASWLSLSPLSLALAFACGGGGGGGSTPVPPANHAPVFASTAPSTAKEGHAYTYLINATDADGDAITLSLAAQPTGASLDAASKTISWTPTTAQVGAAQSFDVLASDGKGGSTHQTWTVTPAANAAPAFSSVAPTTGKEGHAYSYVISATDADSDTITLSLATPPTGASLDAASKTISWTPTAAQVGVAQAFDVLASDGVVSVHQQWSVTPTADAPPVFTSTALTTGATGTVYTYTPAATDADGDTITYSLTTSPTWASLTAGAVTGTPTASGTASFTLRANDGHGKTTDQSWSVSVIPGGNQAPTITSTPSTTATGGAVYTYTLVATDPENDAVTFQLVSGPTGATLTGNALSWTPSTSQERVASAFTVQAKDVWGATSASQTWSVTPSGTIRGTRMIIHTPLNWATGKATQDSAPDPTSAPISAMVPTGSGSFTSLAGTYNATDGTFSVPAVPGGSFWLVQDVNYVWTNKSQVDFGYLRQGRKDVSYSTTVPTPLSLSITGMTPWVTREAIQFYDWNSKGLSYLNLDPATTNLPAPGDAALNNLTVDWTSAASKPGLVDTTKGDHPLLIHMAVQVAGAEVIFTTKDVFEFSTLTMADGTPSNLGGSFTTPAAATSPFLLNWAQTDFLNCLNAVSPSGVTVYDSEAFLAGFPDLTGTGMIAGSPVDLVRCVPGGSTDVNSGAISFASLPGHFTPVGSVEVGFQKPFLLSGTTTPTNHIYWVNSYSATLPTASVPMKPLVTPVQSLKIDGQSCTGDLTGVGLTPTLSWTAPATGTPAGYIIFIFELKASGAATTETFVAQLTTSTSSVQLPTGIFKAGSTYDICVRAITSPSWDPTAAPFLHLEPAAYGYADATSGMLTTAP